MSIQGAQIDFPAGKVIFNQGDPGGDLYFIKAGEVEVFRMEKGLEVNLATLREGEVLGIMTCLTREPRLASARAKGAVRAVVVKQAGIKTLITSTPAWVNTVIKDFILRIKQIDDLYAQAMAKLEKHQFGASMLDLAATYAGGMAELGALMVPTGGERIVDLTSTQQRLARILGVGEPELERIFQVFIESGLLKVDVKAPTRRAELVALERLGFFAQATRAYLGSEETRKLYDALDAPACAGLMHLCERARAKLAVTADEVKLELAEVSPEKLGPAAMKAAAEAVVALGVARFEPVAKLAFVPNKLSQMVRCVSAIQRLRSLAPVTRVEAPAVQILTENF